MNARDDTLPFIIHKKSARKNEIANILIQAIRSGHEKKSNMKDIVSYFTHINPSKFSVNSKGNSYFKNTIRNCLKKSSIFKQLNENAKPRFRCWTIKEDELKKFQLRKSEITKCTSLNIPSENRPVHRRKKHSLPVELFNLSTSIEQNPGMNCNNTFGDLHEYSCEEFDHLNLNQINSLSIFNINSFESYKDELSDTIPFLK
ncbi:hypothetical protein HZS_4615 [Henneguya salminicola]|nr:hypothetical protein HZS_4615 [Henneguya salminicola]